MAEVTVIQTNLSIRVDCRAFIGMRAALVAAANQYPEKPVCVELPIMEMDQEDLAGFHVVHDSITLAIADIGHCSEDSAVISIRAKVVNGSREIETVPVRTGNAIDDVKILNKGSDVMLVVDTLLGDGAIIKNVDPEGEVVLVNPIAVLPRLEILTNIPVPSEENAIDFDEFSEDYEEYDGYSGRKDEDQDDDDEEGDGDGDGSGSGS